MKHVLLLGAGFSRNWGGWLASEVNGHLPTSPGIRANTHVLEVLKRTADYCGFEAALSELQEVYAKTPTDENRHHLNCLQEATLAMFGDMEAGFASRHGSDFCNDLQFNIAKFLSPFDAIFSLNQDLLFERHYHDIDLALNQPKKFISSRRMSIAPPGATLARASTCPAISAGFAKSPYIENRAAMPGKIDNRR